MFFDIGANVGSWTSSNLISTNKIVAVEASPSTFKLLTDNHGNNPKVVCLNYAICNESENKDDFVDFYNSECHFLSTLNVEWLVNEKSRFCNSNTYNAIKVRRLTLDSMINKYGIPDLLKIDVEGGEYHVISSLSIKVPLICFEWASETNDITFKCLEHLSMLGFKEFYVQNGDLYTFRPSKFFNLEETLNTLNNTKPKIDWGMVWCR